MGIALEYSQAYSVTIEGVLQLIVLFLKDPVGHPTVHTAYAHWGLLASSNHTRKPQYLLCGHFPAVPWLLAGCSQRKPRRTAESMEGTSVSTDLGLPSLMWDLSGWLLAIGCCSSGDGLLYQLFLAGPGGLRDGGCCHHLGPCTQLSSMYGPPFRSKLLMSSLSCPD